MVVYIDVRADASVDGRVDMRAKENEDRIGTDIPIEFGVVRSQSCGDPASLDPARAIYTVCPHKAKFHIAGIFL